MNPKHITTLTGSIALLLGCCAAAHADDLLAHKSSSVTGKYYAVTDHYSGDSEDERDSQIFRRIYNQTHPKPVFDQIHLLPLNIDNSEWTQSLQSMITADADSPVQDQFRIGGYWQSETPDQLYLYIYDDSPRSYSPSKDVDILSIDINVDGNIHSFPNAQNIEFNSHVLIPTIPIAWIRAMNSAKHCLIAVHTAKGVFRIDYSAPINAHGDRTAIHGLKWLVQQIDTALASPPKPLPQITLAEWNKQWGIEASSTFSPPQR